MSQRSVDPRDVHTLVDVARRVVPMTWGLDTFVAANPLHGFEDLAFEDAALEVADLFDARAYPGHRDGSGRAQLVTERGQRRPSERLVVVGTAGVADVVDAFVAHWCATHRALVEHAVHGDRPDLYATWRRLAPHDPDLARRGGPGHRERALALPERAADAVVATLDARGIEPSDAVAYLEAQLARLPGWAAAFAREVDTGDRHALVEFAATRLAVEHLLVAGDGGHGATPARDSSVDPDAAEGLAAAEAAYRDRLLAGLAGAAVADGDTRAPEVQLVFCIDVRSEGIRRPLEALGPYETLGFAGFFGLPIAVREDAHADPVPHCPVILDPRASVIDPGRHHDDDVHDRFVTAKTSATSGYVLADAAGWLLGIKTLGTSLAPRWWDRAARALRRAPAADEADLVIDPSPDLPSDIGLTAHDQIQVALSALTAMGLTRDFAPVVVFCGHHSDHRNNPFRSALHCGACGGNPGGTNARVLAAICNRPEVRAGLAEAGLVIGDDTWFVAATHETTDDVVTLLEVDGAPEHVTPQLGRLIAALEAAGEHSRRERLVRQPGSPVPARRPRRSADPAQVVPDWGLARNAAIVVGPRHLSAHIDLDRRVFLHSYRPDDDPDGTVLEAIMTGPVVVAHWISSQYYFSTVDPLRFGAGSKPFHNVIGRLGVAEATSCDLRNGLPFESVAFGGEAFHEPLRLLVVIDAPGERVDHVIGRNPVLRRLGGNGWVRFVARPADTATAPFVERGRDGSWTPWQPGTSACDDLDNDERSLEDR
ncbi:MAG: putative inorganic carbon transporter subunit DabA [Acidimicrobiales bacterium]